LDFKVVTEYYQLAINILCVTTKFVTSSVTVRQASIWEQVKCIRRM